MLALEVGALPRYLRQERASDKTRPDQKDVQYLFLRKEKCRGAR